jgi:hypothetical protein
MNALNGGVETSAPTVRPRNRRLGNRLFFAGLPGSTASLDIVAPPSNN